LKGGERNEHRRAQLFTFVTGLQALDLAHDQEIDTLDLQVLAERALLAVEQLAYDLLAHHRYFAQLDHVALVDEAAALEDEGLDQRKLGHVSHDVEVAGLRAARDVLPVPPAAEL
jgi:hypothetical protein